MNKINRLKYLFVIFSWLCVSLFVEAQDQLSNGLLLEDEAYNKLPLIKKEDGTKYPIASEGSLKMYCPIPGNQGAVGACVGWATGYHALTISKAIQQNIKNPDAIESQTYSASYIFNHIKKDNDCSKGAYLTDALSFLQLSGTPFSKFFNNSLFDCTARPNAEVVQEAFKNRINTFNPIFKLDEKESIKIEETKLWIARKKPVIIGLNLTKNFEDIAFGQKKWIPNLKEKTNNYHAMVVVGYENKGTYGEFELLNSHGPHWGNDGFIKINYKDFAQLVKYAFVIDSIGSYSEEKSLDFSAFHNMPTLGTSATAISSQVALHHIQYQADDSYDFVSAPFYFDRQKKCYQSKQGTWELDSQYQLTVKKLVAGRQVYIFSVDAQDRVIPIWPSSHPLDKWRGSQYTEVVIPSEKSALQLSKVGRDYVVLLYSNTALVDFDKQLDKFSQSKGSVEERLQSTFGEQLVADNLVEYASETIEFNCALPDKSTYLIPVIIAFDVK